MEGSWPLKPRTANHGETELEWRISQWSNTLERDRARSYFQAYAAAAALYFLEQALGEVQGIDIIRTVRSFEPCMPCGVHLYLGEGKVLEARHSPTFGARVR